ncbi:MAG: protein kinase [Kofleriaceae bacterium]|nr:protein kinase [Kofleriaceae bacterium]
MIGTVVGSYTLAEQLAAGGMGSVWLAKHAVMERPAVVKLLHPELGRDPELVERFFNEARAAASIQDPGIVQVFDVGRLPDGHPYLVMERLIGETLAARVRARKARALDRARLTEIVQLLRLVARTLAAAHDKGIVHRDLKPENIFVVADPDVDGGERIKILDFGIAKLAAGTPSQLTRAGAFFGTPAYMAPEQCSDAGTVDARADLYAVGCIAYEMLAGTPPFGVGGIELVAAQMRDAPPPLAERAPGTPPALAAIVERLLRKRPAERFPSALALYGALERVSLATDEPARDVDLGATLPSVSPAISAQPPALPPVTATAPRRRWPLVASMALLAAGLAAVIVIATSDESSSSVVAAAPVTTAPSEPGSAAIRAAPLPVPPAAPGPVTATDPAAVASPEPAPAPSVAPRGRPASAPRPTSRPAPPRVAAPPVKVEPSPPPLASDTDERGPVTETPLAPTPGPPTPPEDAHVPATPRRAVRALEAGPIWDGKDARKKCPKVCSAPLTWTGGWRTTVRGKQSTCDCDGPAE